jgi:hypothetical protein
MLPTDAGNSTHLSNRRTSYDKTLLPLRLSPSTTLAEDPRTPSTLANPLCFLPLLVPRPSSQQIIIIQTDLHASKNRLICSTTRSYNIPSISRLSSVDSLPVSTSPSFYLSTSYDPAKPRCALRRLEPGTPIVQGGLRWGIDSSPPFKCLGICTDMNRYSY